MEGAFAEITRMPTARPRVGVAPASALTSQAGPGQARAGQGGIGQGGAGQAEAGQGGIGLLPVLPALRDLLPRGGLACGSVVSVPEFGLLSLALAAGAVADGAWCGIAGVPEAGVMAAAGLGLDPERMLLVPDPGTVWPQVVSSLLDGCELVLVRPPGRAPAQVRQRLEATLRRAGGVLLVAGDWPGAQLRLRVVAHGWTGLGDGHGRLRACCAEVVADGRGEAARPRASWLWLPAEDGTVAAATAADVTAAGPSLGTAGLAAGLLGDAGPALRAVGS
jgi:hypothetical protein